MVNFLQNALIFRDGNSGDISQGYKEAREDAEKIMNA